MLCLDPCPMATIAITAATPIIMPSMVRKDLILLRLIAFHAMRKRLTIFMVLLLTIPEWVACFAILPLHCVHYYLSLIHISEPTRQAEISYAVFCLKKKKTKTN